MLKCTTCKGTTDKGACTHCCRRLTKMLKELIAFIDLLIASPTLRQQVSSEHEGRGSMSSALVINVQILDLISYNGVQSVLKSWAEYIVETRKLDADALKATKTINKLHTYQNILTTHSSWIAEQDCWEYYYLEIKEPWTTLKRIIYGERKPTKAVSCPVQDCNGTLHLEANGHVHCKVDATHEWPYERWSGLANLLIEPIVQASDVSI